MVTNLLADPNLTGSSLNEMGELRVGCNMGEMVDVDANGDGNEKATKTQAKCDSQSQCDAKPLTEKQDSVAYNENNCNYKNQSNVDISNRKAGGYLIAVHRKLSRQDTYFLSYHKTRPSLFGVPLLIPCYESGTNKGTIQ